MDFFIINFYWKMKLTYIITIAIFLYQIILQSNGILCKVIYKITRITLKNVCIDFTKK